MYQVQERMEKKDAGNDGPEGALLGVFLAISPIGRKTDIEEEYQMDSSPVCIA